jgi:uncharacterized protein
MLPLPGLDDAEGQALPRELPPVVDAHVHLFPDGVFEAVWRWFEKHGWPIRYKLRSPDVLQFLFDRGVSRVVALHYAHKPGMARSLNTYIAALARADPRVIGLATVLPGEPDAEGILAEAFAVGLQGVKLHCHVQCFAPDSPTMQAIYAACARAHKPLVIHAGREPKSAAYKCDPYALCSAERIGRALEDWPGLKICVPHLGANEFDAYERLLERYDNLWLDTTMMLADYLPVKLPRRLLDCRPERILYGTDFPNLPYAWDREVKKIAAWHLSDERLARLLSLNALALYA